MPTIPAPSTHALINVSFQLILYTLQQLPPEAQEVVFSPETQKEFPLGLQVPRYDPLFNGPAPLPIQAICIRKALYRGTPQLGIQLENDYLSLNESNYSSFYLHIHRSTVVGQTWTVPSSHRTDLSAE